MQLQGNPFSKVDKQTVIGTLKATGSKDPDVLHAQKTTILTTVKFGRLAGALLMFCGVLLTLTILGAFLGIPAFLIGWWFRSRGSKNLATVEEGYSEYLAQVGA
ncbi:MAG: hypothetical protein ABI647_17245 [Gemmatimonadota bacterium]